MQRAQPTTDQDLAILRQRWSDLKVRREQREQMRADVGASAPETSSDDLAVQLGREVQSLARLADRSMLMGADELLRALGAVTKARDLLLAVGN